MSSIDQAPHDGLPSSVSGAAVVRRETPNPSGDEYQPPRQAVANTTLVSVPTPPAALFQHLRQEGSTAWSPCLRPSTPHHPPLRRDSPSGRAHSPARCAPAQPRPPALGPQQASLHAVPQPLRRTWTRKYSLFTRNLSAAGVQELTWQPRAGHRLGSREGGAVSQSSTELQTQSSRPRAGVGARLHPAPASHSTPRWPVIRKSRVRRVRSPLPWKQSQDRRRSEAPDGRKARLPAR